MSLPVGHAFMGLTVLTLARPSGARGPSKVETALACALANVPDFDFAGVWFLGWPAAAHRAATHSLGFALLLGAAVAWARRAMGWTARPWRETLVWSGVVLSHALLDLVAYDVSPPNHGVMFWWPFSAHRWLSGWSMYPITFMDKSGMALVESVAVILAMELVVFGGLWWLARAFKARAVNMPGDVPVQMEHS